MDDATAPSQRGRECLENSGHKPVFGLGDIRAGPVLCGFEPGWSVKDGEVEYVKRNAAGVGEGKPEGRLGDERKQECEAAEGAGSRERLLSGREDRVVDAQDGEQKGA